MDSKPPGEYTGFIFCNFAHLCILCGLSQLQLQEMNSRKLQMLQRKKKTLPEYLIFPSVSGFEVYFIFWKTSMYIRK